MCAVATLHFSLSAEQKKTDLTRKDWGISVSHWWSRRTWGCRGRPEDSVSALICWCWRSEGDGPTAPACPGTNKHTHIHGEKHTQNSTHETERRLWIQVMHQNGRREAPVAKSQVLAALVGFGFLIRDPLLMCLGARGFTLGSRQPTIWILSCSSVFYCKPLSLVFFVVVVLLKKYMTVVKKMT